MAANKTTTPPTLPSSMHQTGRPSVGDLRGLDRSPEKPWHQSRERDLWLLVLGGAMASTAARKLAMKSLNGLMPDVGISGTTVPLEKLWAAVESGDTDAVWSLLAERFGLAKGKPAYESLVESLAQFVARRAAIAEIGRLEFAVRAADKATSAADLMAVLDQLREAVATINPPKPPPPVGPIESDPEPPAIDPN